MADIRVTILAHLTTGDNETETAWRVARVVGSCATSGKRPAASTASSLDCQRPRLPAAGADVNSPGASGVCGAINLLDALAASCQAGAWPIPKSGTKT